MERRRYEPRPETPPSGTQRFRPSHPNPERTAHARQGPPDRGHSRIQRFRPPRLAQPVRRRLPPPVPRSPSSWPRATWRPEPMATPRRLPGHAGSKRRMIPTPVHLPDRSPNQSRPTSLDDVGRSACVDSMIPIECESSVQPAVVSGASFSRSASRFRRSVTRRRLLTRVTSSSLLTGFERKSSVPLSTARS